MSRYAERTEVSEGKSQQEIRQTLKRYGADQFAFAEDSEANVAIIAFRMQGRQVRFRLAMPDLLEFRRTPTGLYRNPETAQRAWEQACKQRWRALGLIVKAKLEAIESGLVSFEDEFLSHILLPDRSTVGEWVGPQVEEVYRTGRMPRALPMLEEHKALPGG